MRIFYTLFLIVISLNSFSQRNNKIIKQKLKEANYYYQYDNFYFALPVFKEILQLDTLNLEAEFKYGVCLFNVVDNKSKSKQYFEKTKHIFPDSYFYLGRIFHSEELFDQAINAYTNYNNTQEKLSFDEKTIEFFIAKSKVAKQFTNNKNNIEIKNMGKQINTQFPDYGTVLSNNEKKMYFTSRRSNGTSKIKDVFDNFYEDIYVSRKVNDKWLDSKNIGTPVNTIKHDACVTISKNSKELYIYRTNADSTGGDIYISKFKDKKWTEPQIIKANINARLSWTPSGSISADGITFYFASNRKGGFGGKDIYKVSKLPNNKWSLAQNLGASINTEYDDDAPYICNDNKTLYFSSKGHKNMGKFDIFVSYLDSNIWSPSENLAAPINSVENDIYYIPSSDQVSAYFSSDRKGGFGKSDIYKAFDIGHITNYVAVKGLVKSKNNETINAEISIIDYYSRELYGIYKTNKNTSKFLMILFKNRKYKMIIEADGYQSYIEDFELDKSFKKKQILKNITLTKNE